MKLAPLFTALSTALALAFTLSTTHASEQDCPAIDGYETVHCNQDDALFLIADKKTNLYGYANQQGKIVIAPQFNYAYPFIDDRAVVEKDTKYGVINQQGKIVIPFEYRSLHNFSRNTDGEIEFKNDKGLISAIKEHKVGLLDKDGRVIIDFLYENLDGSFYFFDGISYAIKDGKYGFVDETGQVIIPFDYEQFFNISFHKNIIEAKKNGKWGAIDKHNNTIIDFDYDNLVVLNNQLVSVTKDNKSGIISQTGKIMIPMIYQDIAPFYQDKDLVLFIGKYNGKYRLFDIQGKPIGDIEYDYVRDFLVDGLIVVGKDNKMGMIDLTGKVILPMQYDYLSSFKNGVAIAANDKGQYGGIDKQQNIVIPFDYADLQEYSNNLIMARKYDETNEWKNSKVGIIDGQNNVIIPFIYQQIIYEHNNKIPVQQNDKWGVVDMTGKVIVPLIYDKITLLDGIEVELNGETFYIDETGKRIR